MHILNTYEKYFKSIVSKIRYKPRNSYAKLRNNFDKFGVILYFRRYSIFVLFCYFDVPMNVITIYL